MDDTLCTIIAKLLCGRRPQEWSLILILRGMLVIFMVVASGMARGRVRRTSIRRISWHSYMRQIFAQLIANGVVNWTLLRIFFYWHYGFAPHETLRSNMQISFQKHVQGMHNKMQNCQSFKSRVYINVTTIVSALSVRINDLFIEEQCP